MASSIILLITINLVTVVSTAAMQCDIPGECEGQIIGSDAQNVSSDHFIMLIGGFYTYQTSKTSLPPMGDVELYSIDPELNPVPDCQAQLSPLPTALRAAAGGLDHSSKQFWNCKLKVFHANFLC